METTNIEIYIAATPENEASVMHLENVPSKYP